MIKINRNLFNGNIGFKDGNPTELHYNRTRWYDPAVGSWLNENPVGCHADDTNVTPHRVAPHQNRPTRVATPVTL